MRKNKPTSRRTSKPSTSISAGAAGADPLGPTLGARLRAAMADLDDVIAGRVRPEERLTVRTAELPDDLADYGPRDVRAVREELNVSQMVFAHLIGASAALVRAWEQGARARRRWPAGCSTRSAATHAPGGRWSAGRVEGGRAADMYSYPSILAIPICRDAYFGSSPLIYMRPLTIVTPDSERASASTRPRRTFTASLTRFGFS